MKIEIRQGDITRVADVDAVVNAANITLLGGGGVDGAIHRAAGPLLKAFCRDHVPEQSPGIRCPVGGAVITTGFELPVGHIIHTVGPIFPGTKARAIHYPGEAVATTHREATDLLASSIRSCLQTARVNGLRSIAMPAISCGVFGCPIPVFVVHAIEELRANADAVDRVVFVLWLDREVAEFKATWDEWAGVFEL